MEFMTTGVLQVLLLAIFFFALFLEIKTGGMGAGVLLGLVAAGVFWGSQYVQGLVSLYEIALFLGGILLIVIELVLPTVGLLAGLGIAMLLYSILLALGGDMSAVGAMAIALVLSAAVFFAIIGKLPSSKLWNKVVLHDKSTKERGYVSAPEEQSLVGARGTVLTELRPSGTALIGGRHVDVVSEGAFLAKGTEIVVLSVNGSRVLVEEAAKETDVNDKDNNQ